ncbi:MAG: tetratricopeptide repeat protein, partial [Pseudomonadota bacterium]
LDAAASGSNAFKARSLFAERVGHKVHSSWSWHGYSNALAALGDKTSARAAARKSTELQAGAEE